MPNPARHHTKPLWAKVSHRRQARSLCATEGEEAIEPQMAATANHNRLMHAKYTHERCSLLMHIPTYYNIISCYNHDLQ
jgi:hypothetical protein